MKTVILSGISGSGKTTFLKALEDAGYFCVDNFPLILLQKFVEVCGMPAGKIGKSAFVVDIREREFFSEGKELLKTLKEKHGAEIIFLDGSDEALMRRFRETRRSHPLLNRPNVMDALAEERELVNWIKEMADQVIDTTYLTPHD
jgi:Predicted P-loop-containing kinase